MPIIKVNSRQILDYVGYPTVEVDIVVNDSGFRASVANVFNPYDHGCVQLRDLDENVYKGCSVKKAVDNVKKVLGESLIKSQLEVQQQNDIDTAMRTLDNTADKSNLGANAILPISIAVVKAAAFKKSMAINTYIASLIKNTDCSTYIPVPAFTLIRGGEFTQSKLSFDEFMILPTGAQDLQEAHSMAYNIIEVLKDKLETPLVGNTGFLAPNLEENTEAIQHIEDAIKGAGYDGKVKIAININASAFFKDGKYDLKFKSEESDPEEYKSTEDMIGMFKDIKASFPSVIMLEDPLHKEDYEGWTTLTTDLPNVMMVGDHLIGSNLTRFQKAIAEKAANCVSLGLEHIGTISETLQFVEHAKKFKWSICIGSGDVGTDDTFISHFAIGIGADIFKVGAPSSNPNIVRYNQLVRLEAELGSKAQYAGPELEKKLTPEK